MSMAAVLAACGGSGSETPPPVEPTTPGTQPLAGPEDSPPPGSGAVQEPSEATPEGEGATPPPEGAEPGPNPAR